MSSGRHIASHKLEKPRKAATSNSALRNAVVAAPVVTATAVGAGVLATAPSFPADFVTVPASSNLTAGSDLLESRAQAVSRSAERPVGVSTSAKPLRLRDKKFTTAELDLRKTARADAEVADSVSEGSKVIATGQVKGEYAEVAVAGEFYWVTAEYLTDEAPADPASIGLSNKPCPGSAIEAGLTDRADRVYRAVCNAFPAITRYGGRDGHGEHSTGRAIDIMVSDVKLGTDIAEFLRAHAAELDLYDVIWRQHIWTPVRAGEGWRWMPSRGSATANHYDHVHVSVY